MSKIVINVDKRQATVTHSVRATKTAPAREITTTLDYSNVSDERVWKDAIEARIVKVQSTIRAKEAKEKGSGYKFASGTIDVANMGERKVLSQQEKLLRAAKDLGIDSKKLAKMVAEANK